MMDYRIERKPKIKVLEKSRVFKNHQVNEYDVDLNQIPAFWDECHADGTIKTLSKQSGDKIFGSKLLGICRNDYCENKENFLYSIAAEYNGGEVPQGFDVFLIPANTWAVFKAKDAPEEVTNTWKKIYTEFFPTSDWSPKNEIAFEVYANAKTGDATLDYEIWIPVEKKL